MNATTIEKILTPVRVEKTVSGYKKRYDQLGYGLRVGFQLLNIKATDTKTRQLIWPQKFPSSSSNKQTCLSAVKAAILHRKTALHSIYNQLKTGLSEEDLDDCNMMLDETTDYKDIRRWLALGKPILYDFEAERTQREETPAIESQVTISQVDLTENIVVQVQPEDEKTAIVQVVGELVELILYDFEAESTQREETSATESQVVQVDETPQPEEEKAAIVQVVDELEDKDESSLLSVVIDDSATIQQPRRHLRRPKVIFKDYRFRSQVRGILWIEIDG